MRTDYKCPDCRRVFRNVTDDQIGRHHRTCGGHRFNFGGTWLTWLVVVCAIIWLLNMASHH